MLELFEKHLSFVAPELKELKYELNEKNLYKFSDALVQKHWLSFYATYKAGYKQGCVDALNQISIHCINELNNV